MSNWVIGVDPSSSIKSVSNAIGWVIFKDGELESFGELAPDPLEGFYRVRQWLKNRFKMISVRDPKPEVTVAVESVFLGQNPNVFYNLTRVKAFIEVITLENAHSYREVSALQSFQAITGLKQYPLKNPDDPDSGRSKTRKPAIQSAVKEKYPVLSDEGEHISDACAIAVSIIKGNRP